MSVRQNLVTGLQQKLVLTPQMRQRIELLAMTKIEMVDMIVTEVTANPVLDTVEPGDAPDEPGGMQDEIASIDAVAADYSTPELPTSAIEAQALERLESSGNNSASETATYESEVERERDSFQEIDFGSTFEEYLDPGYKTHEYEAREETSFESMLTRRQSLYEQLIWQIHLVEAPREVISAGEAIIGNLDENTGFLDATLDEIAAM